MSEHTAKTNGRPKAPHVPAPVWPVTVPIEEDLAASVRAMRKLAADAGTDDACQNWSRTALERRPLVFLAVVDNGSAHAWAMAPDAAPRAGTEWLLTSSVIHLGDASGRHDLARAKDGRKTKLMFDLLTQLNWMLWEESGEFLVDRAKLMPQD